MAICVEGIKQQFPVNSSVQSSHWGKKLCQRDGHLRRQGTVFGPSSNQEEVFSDLQMEQLISKVVEGYHATVFAYGQTGWDCGEKGRPTTGAGLAWFSLWGGQSFGAMSRSEKNYVRVEMSLKRWWKCGTSLMRLGVNDQLMWRVQSMNLWYLWLPFGTGSGKTYTMEGYQYRAQADSPQAACVLLSFCQK